MADEKLRQINHEYVHQLIAVAIAAKQVVKKAVGCVLPPNSWSVSVGDMAVLQSALEQLNDLKENVAHRKTKTFMGTQVEFDQSFPSLGESEVCSVEAAMNAGSPSFPDTGESEASE